jgi:ribosomal protein S18 acetylase RimI-like enzyme
VGEVEFRSLTDEDYTAAISVVNEWWGGRPVAEMLPRLLFQHFQDTSFAAVRSGKPTLVGFLVGFVSQSNPEEAFVHFVGVDPAHRNRGIARELYVRFFDAVRIRGCRRVRCVTSPENTGSIAFHLRLGFHIVPGDSTEGGVSVASNYDGRGHARVRFLKELLPD